LNPDGGGPSPLERFQKQILARGKKKEVRKKERNEDPILGKRESAPGIAASPKTRGGPKRKITKNLSLKSETLDKRQIKYAKKGSRKLIPSVTENRRSPKTKRREYWGGGGGKRERSMPEKDAKESTPYSSLRSVRVADARRRCG